MPNPLITSFAVAKGFVDSARTPTKGRRYNRFAKWFIDGDGYRLDIHGVPFFRITPDDVGEFIIRPENAYPIKNTLSGWVGCVIPFFWARIDIGRYRVGFQRRYWGTTASQLRPLYPRKSDIKAAPEIFSGLKFDMKTGRAINEKPPLVSTVVPEAHEVWITSLRVWKQKVKTMVRLGAFDSIIAEYEKIPTTAYNMWETEEDLDMLYEAIKGYSVSFPLMRKLVASNKLSRLQGRRAGLYEHTESILKRSSVQLRKRFGVFGNHNGPLAERVETGGDA